MSTVPWIRLYQNWPRHRKTMALRKALGTAEPILCLWLWAAENAQDGDLSGIDPSTLEFAAGWSGRRGKCLAAMIEVGFLDSDGVSLRLHDWMEGTGAGVESLKIKQDGAAVRTALRRDPQLMKLVKERDQSKCRYCGNLVDWLNHRGANGGTYDHVIPISMGGGNSLDNVVVACRACNAGKRNRTPEEARMRLLPEPAGNLPVTTQSGTNQSDLLSPDLGTSDPTILSNPDQSNPRAKSAHDWLSSFSAKYWPAKGRPYGQGESDSKACARLAEYLETLPADQRAADWEARERMIAEFFASTDRATVGAGWPFAFFVSAFRGLAIPPEQRPKVTPAGKPAPMQARY